MGAFSSRAHVKINQKAQICPDTPSPLLNLSHTNEDSVRIPEVMRIKSRLYYTEKSLDTLDYQKIILSPPKQITNSQPLSSYQIKQKSKDKIEAPKRGSFQIPALQKDNEEGNLIEQKIKDSIVLNKKHIDVTAPISARESQSRSLLNLLHYDCESSKSLGLKSILKSPKNASKKVLKVSFGFTFDNENNLSEYAGDRRQKKQTERMTQSQKPRKSK